MFEKINAHKIDSGDRAGESRIAKTVKRRVGTRRRNQDEKLTEPKMNGGIVKDSKPKTEE